jgi:DNA-binding IclR family transcriptional regulator
VDRAFAILECLAKGGGCATLADLARAMDLSRSTVHGLLATMRQHGVVSQDADGSYILGIRLFELGNQAVYRLDLRTAAGPVIQRLVEHYQETVHLAIGDGMDVVYIDKRESRQSMQIVSRIGQRLPAYCTALGKAMMAFKPEEELDRLLAKAQLFPLTPNTLTDKFRLKEHLRQVRRQGYALDREEFAEGLCCVGTPIWDYSNQVVGALSVSGPTVRMNPGKINQAIGETMAAAYEISRQLGYRGLRRAPEDEGALSVEQKFRKE